MIFLVSSFFFFSLSSVLYTFPFYPWLFALFLLPTACGLFLFFLLSREHDRKRPDFQKSFLRPRKSRLGRLLSSVFLVCVRSSFMRVLLFSFFFLSLRNYDLYRRRRRGGQRHRGGQVVKSVVLHIMSLFFRFFYLREEDTGVKERDRVRRGRRGERRVYFSGR